MSWNKYYIFVNQQPNPNVKELLSKLGLGDYKPSGEANLYDTNKPQTLFVGHYNDCLIFSDPQLPFKFFEAVQTIEEKRFIACFPNSEIFVMIEDGTCDAFGFCIIKNGQRIRIKDGCDDEIYNDWGTPLPEEFENYQDLKAVMDEKEKAEIIEYDGEDGLETYLSFQAAWGIPNILSKKYLGDYIGNVDGYKIAFTSYETLS